MLELSILGFLAEEPLHGYELRNRLAALAGHTRPVSDGSLYPAINRLATSGLIRREIEPGASAARRHTLHLTEAGHTELLRRLRDPSELDVTDSSRFFTVLAFLSRLPRRSEREAVLRRRLAFLERPASFFHRDGRPLTSDDIADPYRRGMLRVARATSRAERDWLRETLGEDNA